MNRTHSLSVLVVEPDDHDFKITRHLLREQQVPQFRVLRAPTVKSAAAMLAMHSVDAILFELTAEGNRCFEALEFLFDKSGNVPIIVFSEFADEEIGAEAIRHGAEDYIVKGDIDCRTLARTIVYAITRNRRAGRPADQHSDAIMPHVARPYDELSLLVSAPNPIVVRDISGTVRTWSRATTEMFGWTAEEAVGKKLHRLLNTHGEITLAAIERALLREGSWVGQLTQSRKDGSQLTVQARWELKTDVWGKPSGVIETYADITQQKLIEATLREGETFFRTMADSVDYVMYFAMPALQGICYVNDEYERIWRSTCSSLYRDPRSFLKNIVPDDRISLVEPALQQAARSGILDVRYRINTEEGTKIIWDHSFAVRTPKGRLNRVCGFAMDMTKRLEMALPSKEAH